MINAEVYPQDPYWKTDLGQFFLRMVQELHRDLHDNVITIEQYNTKKNKLLTITHNLKQEEVRQMTAEEEKLARAVLHKAIDQRVETPYSLVEFCKLSKQQRAWVYDQWSRHHAGVSPI